MEEGDPKPSLSVNSNQLFLRMGVELISMGPHASI